MQINRSHRCPSCGLDRCCCPVWNLHLAGCDLHQESEKPCIFGRRLFTIPYLSTESTK